MKIKIIGQNSSSRMKLIKNINKALEEIKESIEIELVSDQSKFSKYNISNTPVLILNNKIVSQGKVPTDREIKNYMELLSCD